jgi:outer membrane autotransporter protein
MLKSRLLAASVLAASAISFAAPAAAQRVDSITAFGDSYADDGNFFQLIGGIPPALQPVYPTGRFSGGTNYVDSLSQILAVPVDNFAIGGALTNNTNTNGVGIPGFTFETQSFLAGGGGVFPTVSPTFDENDLVTVSVGGNDARFYQQTGGTLAGAPAAATASAAFATTNLNALVGAGAQNISFLAGNTAILPEIANNPNAQAIRNAFSTTFNSAIQSTLAGYAADGVMVHYLDLTLVGQQIAADPAAYGLQSAGACPVACVSTPSLQNNFLFYVDNLHLTSAGFHIVAKYIATQLEAPLTLQATSDMSLDVARQFGRTLSSRMDVGAPRDGDMPEGVQFFLSGDGFSRSQGIGERNEAYRSSCVGVTGGVEFGFGSGMAGIAANYSKPKVNFGGDAADTKSRSFQVGGYASMGIAGGFAQGYAGYGWNKHDIDRAGVVEGMEADPKGHHFIVGGKAGYLMPMGSVRVGPVVALDYAKAKVDSYTETGDPALTLNVSSIDYSSLRGSIGAELRGDFDGGGIQLRPYLAAVVEKDFTGDARTVHFAQTSAPTIVNSFRFDDASKKAYGRVSGGFSAAILDQVRLDVSASGTISKDQGNETSANVGFRVGF